MKQLQKITLGMLAMVLTTFAGASTASATTLEIGGVQKNEAVALKASLSGSFLVMDTNGSFANTCTISTLEGKTSTFTGSIVSVPLTAMSFSKCAEEPFVVDSSGTLTIANIASTTSGTVRSIGAKITSPSPYGTLNCTTAASPGTHIGTLTGVKAGAATLDFNVVINCGFFLPSARWEAAYTITSPEGLGVTS